MSTREDSIPHELRTAAEPRQNKLYPIRLSQIIQVNPSIRLLRLTLPPAEDQTDKGEAGPKPEPFAFLPGQWLDVFIPSITQAGGFTITSTPADAQLLPSPEPPTESLSVEEGGSPPVQSAGRLPYVELAVQESPSNPAAAWLWRPKEEILGKELNVRVGGSFVWPPAGFNLKDIRNVVFIAGGVGINPLISMFSHLSNNDTASVSPGTEVHFLYSTRLPSVKSASDSQEALDQILFLPHLREIIHSHAPSRRLHISLDLFVTNLDEYHNIRSSPPKDMKIHDRRITADDLKAAVTGSSGDETGSGTVCYVCGPPPMTDGFVDRLTGMIGRERVFCEKWW
ncbi:hypothetical protein PVAR5_6521 [Paecilomyces variotii No. 5]|uniref:FAD-binding FR-type domain-containing protein n=1 Tax=Byssochlamys spectabilis (strain No. 5 / NBRC 109023) TaxID=1356009 RepID=V5FJ46_BYSSN|nr:hypothetical protein PVAR5_6521 [Paecilomyces variotii No. 5]